MDQRSPTFEATLLYKATPALDLNELINGIGSLLKGYEERIIKIEKIDAIYYLLNCRRVKILLAFSNDPLPLSGFENSNRPDATPHRDRQIQARLLQSSASTTILVLERDPDLALYTENTEHLMRDICRDIADLLATQFKADLIFWADTETLYGAEEFDQVCSLTTEINKDPTKVDKDETASSKPKRPILFEDPVVAGAMQDWIQGKQDDPVEPKAKVHVKKRPRFLNWLNPVSRDTPNALGSGCDWEHATP